MTLVYDDGVFKPQGPVPAIKNHAVVHVVIVDEAPAAGGGDDDDGWKAMNKFIGLWKDAPRSDYSENHDEYIYSRR
jgi:hypothetical protein